MSTGVHLIARLIHEFNALSLATHIAECGFHRGRGTHHLANAETTLSGFLELLELLAGLGLVVGLSLTLGAEVFVAVTATDTVFTHMHC